MSEKQVVHYRGNPTFHRVSGLNGNDFYYASVDGLDHPLLGATYIRTSKLVSEPDADGFETLNHIYKRQGD